MIVANRLSKHFGSLTALKDVSFEVASGEVLGFLGPNGAGKSTTLRILSGYLPPSSGSASIGGHDLLNESIPARRLTGYLPESFAAPPELRVGEYLRYRGKLRGLYGPKLNSRLDSVISQLDLESRVDQSFGTLSKGFRQRVGLADALLSEPPALLLDEPFGGLDPLQRHEFRTIIRELAQSGIAVLFSSHVLPEVEELADRVLILHQGVARALGTQDELAGQLQRCTSYRIKINAPSTSFEEDLRNEFPGIAVKALSESVWELEALEESSRSALFSWLANRQEATLEFSPVLPRLEDLFRSTVS